MNVADISVANIINRRNAIRTVASGVVALAAAGSASAEEPHAPRNTRVSLAAYSMREALNGGMMDLFGFIDWCAEMNLAGVELTAYYFRKGFDAVYLHDLRRRAFNRGVTVSGTAVSNNFCLPPGPERQKEIDRMRTWIDAAAELFAPHIRIFAGDIPEGADKRTAIGYAAECIRTVLPHAAERGIVLGLENHHGVTSRAADHLAICDMVGESPWFGVNLDTGNYYTDPYKEMALTAARAVNVQVKVEVMRDENSAKEPADFGKIRNILVNAKYRGWVALEYESDEDPYLAIPRFVRELKRLFEG
jgi:sugar phosphate isomerase/epimerase